MLSLSQPNQLPRKQKLSKILLGIDEVGRGPWAGPLVIGAVILGQNRPEWELLTDSKKLTAKKRESLNTLILEHAAATGLGWVSAAELDQYGLSNSLKLACRRAVKQALQAKQPFGEIVIDGTVNFLRDTPLEDHVTILKKADLLVPEVSAASIIAKVARDRYMIDLAAKYPEYGFEKHVGYGTALHKQALLNHGVCPEHRRSFRPIREILAANPDDRTCSSLNTDNNAKRTATSTGQTAERAVIAHLENNLNHTIIAHNFKTKTYEIDIISTFEDKIYFTEVKYRKTSAHGTPLDQITPEKQAQMRYATKSFLSSHREFTHLQPLLAAASVSGEEYHIDDWFVIL